LFFAICSLLFVLCYLLVAVCSLLFVLYYLFSAKRVLEAVIDNPDLLAKVRLLPMSLSAVCCLLSAVCCLLSAVCCLLPAVCCLLLAACHLLPAAYCVLFVIGAINDICSRMLEIIILLFDSPALSLSPLRNRCNLI
jgi:hypothetical protein